MQTKQITVYDFSELSDSAKDTARQWVLSDGYSWMSESLDSMRVFCDHFGIEIKNWEIGMCSHSFVETDADATHFRGFTLAQARALPEFPTGYCLDSVLHTVFVKEFERAGDAKAAFLSAIHEAVCSVVEDMEYQESEEYLAEHCDMNGYQFNKYGRIAD